MSHAADLARALRTRHVIVVGGGIAGLTAALECAKVGLAVTVVEVVAQLGGTIRRVDLDGTALDAAVEGFAASAGAVRTLADQLGLTVVSASAPRPWVAGVPGGPLPLPSGTVVGIPENPWDERVRRIIGWRGAWRAYLDRLRPPLTIGRQESLGLLVRSRMGEAVHDRLVAPLSAGIYGIDCDLVDADAAAPGLSAALTRTGSLGGAVAQVRGNRTAPAPLLSVTEGMAGLVDALAARLGELGAEVRTGIRIDALVRRHDGRWDATATALADDLDVAPGADGEPAEAPPAIAAADAVIVATGERPARHLLAPHVPTLDADAPPPAEIDVVTLLVRSDELDRDTRGDAVYSVPGTRAAAGLVNVSARWPHVAAVLPPGVHAIRVWFGTLAGDAATDGLDDVATVSLARDEAQAMLAARLEVVGSARVRLPAASPSSALGHADAAAAVRGAVQAAGGLAVCGAWVAGSGLAQVVTDAAAQAERVRASLLWEPA